MSSDQIIALAGVLVSALGPLVVVVVAFIADKRLKRFERSLEDQRRVSDKRLDLYNDIGFQLNDIYSYFRFVGLWKKFNPRQIIERKRVLDRHVYTYQPLFSDEFIKKYHDFIDACFRTYGGWGKDATLRTTSQHRAEHDKPEWANCFTQENNQSEILQTYEALLNCLAEDLGMKRSKP